MRVTKSEDSEVKNLRGKGEQRMKVSSKKDFLVEILHERENLRKAENRRSEKNRSTIEVRGWPYECFPKVEARVKRKIGIDLTSSEFVFFSFSNLCRGDWKCDQSES